MLIFIDDSGDPGFKLSKGSTPYFVIACVIFDDELEAERTSVEIKTLRRELDLSDRYEFKFSKSSAKVREAFIKRIAPMNFRIRAIRVDKSKIRQEELRQRKSKFYNYVIKLVLSHGNGTIVNANIKLDGTADRVYRQEALSYLRRELNVGKDKVAHRIAFKRSDSNVLIQLADMVAGSINREKQNDKSDATLYVGYLRKAKKIQSLWDFPDK